MSADVLSGDVVRNTLHTALHDVLNPATPIGAIAYGILFLLLAIVGSHLLRAWSNRLIRHRSRLFADETAARFIGQLLQVACFIIAIIFYAHLIPALQKFGTALLASAGVVSLVLGLAAQNTLGLLIAGLALLIYRPFAVGDTLVINAPTGKETGKVSDFTLGYTKLTTEDGRLIIIPNSVMITTILIGINENPAAS
jgi:small-conductance mechanosensitive channel